MFVRVLLCACIVSSLLTFAHAEPRSRGQQGGQQHGPQYEPRKASGSIVAVSGNQIRMTTNTNQDVIVMIVPQTTVHLIATALPDYLKRGMCVEFNADLDEKGIGKDKVEQLTIFTPTDERQLGLYAGGAAAGKGEKVKGPIGGDPGIAPTVEKGARKGRAKAAAGGDAGGGGDLFTATAPGASSKPADVKLPASCLVRGKISSIAKGDKLGVQAGKRHVIVELNVSQIDVELAEIAPASPRDMISVEGVGIKDKPGIWAKVVKIDCANQLSTGKKHVPRAEATAKTERAPAKGGKKEEGLDVSGGDKPEPKKKGKAKDDDELPKF